MHRPVIKQPPALPFQSNPVSGLLLEDMSTEEGKKWHQQHQRQPSQANLAQAHAINPLEQPGVYGMALTSCRVQLG